MAEPLKIDAHMHIYPTKEEGRSRKDGGYVIWEYGDKPDVRFSQYDGDIEDALDAIKTSGFSKAVVVPLFAVSWAREQAILELSADLSPSERTAAVEEIDSTMDARLKGFNKWSCEIVKPHSNLIPFVAADPGVLPGEEGAAHLREMVENYGAKGIKLHPVLQGFNMADQRMSPIYRTCEEYGLLIIAHSGPASDGSPYAEPHAFAETLKAFPRLKLVLAHMGGGTWRQTLEIAQNHPNAYFDCCEIIEWTGGSTAPTNREIAQLIKDIGPHRVMLGSDFPWYDLDHTAELVMDLPILSNEEKEAILGANAVRIIGL